MTIELKGDDESNIDLSEIVAAVSPVLPTVAIVGLLFGIGGFAYAKTLEKQYLAIAQFTINSNSDPKLPDLGGALAGLRAGPGGLNEAALASDKIMARDFILELFERIEINDDPFFTGENDTSGPIGFLIETVFGEKQLTPAEQDEKIVQKFRNVVDVDLSDTGIINVGVRHSDPESASNIANEIVDAHIEKIEGKRTQADQNQVILTRNRLSKAKEDLDIAHEAARLFAVENSIRSKEALGASSLNLNRFRQELDTLDAILAGIDYLQRQSSSSTRINVNEFFANHPNAYTPLQQKMGWITDVGSFPKPSNAQLASLKQSTSEERDRLERSISVIKQEAEKNAAAAGQLAKLERNIAVNETIYTSLVSQAEARDFGAELQKSGQVERIQKAFPPLAPFLPRIPLITITAALLGALFTIALRLLRTMRTGTLYTSNRISQAFGVEPVVENAGRTVGYRVKSLDAAIRQTNQPRNVALADLAFTLREENVSTLLILGIPRTHVVSNLATMLAGYMINDDESIAIVDLGSSKGRAHRLSLQSYGVLESVKNKSGISLLNWRESDAKGEGILSLDDALEQTVASSTRTIIVGGSLMQSVFKNRVGLNRADRIILVASGGKIQQLEINWVKKLLTRTPDTKFDLVLI